MGEAIEVRGARVNNLRNIDVDIPRDSLVVMTGLSGSGKSSLAFDTLYAEGQRRYVESLSAYARQFLGRMRKPDCDIIHGLPPAIAIEQKVVSRNPRSTVGTSTEIYDYLRLLFARIGHTISPVSGCEVKRHTVEDVVRLTLSYGPGTRFIVLAPFHIPEGRTIAQQAGIYIQQGFTRMEVRGEVRRIEDCIDSLTDARDVYLLIDRLSVSDRADAISRLTDSVETAFFEGKGSCCLRFEPAGILHEFSTRFEADGITFEEPHENMFAFNSPMGACPECEGFGRIVGISEELVIPDSTRSVYDGAVVCWRGEKMGQWKDEFCRWASYHDFPIFTPYHELTRDQKDMLWHVAPASIDAFFEMVRENQYKIQYRVMLARYRGKTICPRCHGSRLRKEATYVKVAGHSIADLLELSASDLLDFFLHLQLTDHEQQIAERLLIEIRSRLTYLVNVGLGYLTMSRAMNTLSGGESQRINLSKSLGSSLVGSLYVLDEPSIGLHSRDTERLISVLRDLQGLGNTVVVVEHDEEIMRAADHLIDLGPEAGRGGGQVVFQGAVGDINKLKDTEHLNSYTLDYLCGRRRIEPPASRRSFSASVVVRGARANNLRGIDVAFPLNVLTVVTGVSGSGKSTLVRDILFNAIKRRLDEVADRPGEHLAIEGDLDQVQCIEFVDQNPIGKSTRSNPVTYVKAFDEIRALFATLPLSRQMGWTAGFFSFNTEGGRCDECKGEGTITVEMQFMSDLVLTCDACHGKRYKPDVLEARFNGKNIYDVLCMTVNAAVEFFGQHTADKGESGSICRRIVRRLKPLQQVGLGYITLGQSSSTLSGGENQRVKLAYHIGDERPRPTMFIFDEPTTGLHFHDTHRLLSAFNALIERGHTVICIEHNLDVTASADYVIDLGPEAGAGGGSLVACGTPEEIVAQGKGYTAHYLKNKLK